MQKWEEALRNVLAEDGADEALPPSVLQQIQHSPVLLNLATSLAYHRSLYFSYSDMSPRLREVQRQKSADLANILRIMLCI